MNEGEKHAEGIKKEIDDILGTDTFLKPKKRTEYATSNKEIEVLFLAIPSLIAYIASSITTFCISGTSFN